MVTSDEVAVFMRQYQTLQHLSGEYELSGNVERTAPAHMSTYMITGSYWTMGEYPFKIENLSSVLQSKVIAKSLGAEFDMYPLYSADGSLIAHIRYWGAIGGNCEYPDVAYDFLREFLTREAQWELNRDPLLIAFASDYYENGIPVRNKGALLPMIQCVINQTAVINQAPTEYSEDEKEARRLALQTVTLEDSDIPVWDAEIDQVRFEMPMCDAFFFEMNTTLNDGRYGKPFIPTDVDIDELAKEFVTEYRFLLAEG